MKIALPKLKAILLYFGNNTDIKFLGKVKLMKLFYFLDFMHIKKYGSPVTYDTYVNLEHGPVPSTIKNLVDTATEDIDSSVLADTISCQWENLDEDKHMCRIKPRREFTKTDEKYFSHSELEILKKVCERFGDKNAKFIEDASHKESAWLETQLLQEIPYALAVNDSDSQVSQEEIELLMKI
jgi:uncharacterized phage-associated protein